MEILGHFSPEIDSAAIYHEAARRNEVQDEQVSFGAGP
jgi:hypothetical protein